MKRPSFFPDWAAGTSEGNLPAIQPPTDEERTQGIVQGRGLRRQVVNWMFQSLGQWVRYLDNRGVNFGALFEPGRISPRSHDVARFTPNRLDQPEGHFRVGAYVLPSGDGVSGVDAPAYVYPANATVYWVLLPDFTLAPVVGAMPSAGDGTLPAGALTVRRVTTNDSGVAGSSTHPDTLSNESDPRHDVLYFLRPIRAVLDLEDPEENHSIGPKTLVNSPGLKVIYNSGRPDAWGVEPSVYNRNNNGGGRGPAIGILVNAELINGGDNVQCYGSRTAFLHVFGADGLEVLTSHVNERTGNVIKNAIGKGGWRRISHTTITEGYEALHWGDIVSATTDNDAQA